MKMKRMNSVWMRKSVLICSLLLGITLSASSQISSKLQNVAKSMTTVAKASGIDVNSLTSSIMSQLTSKLSLTSAQQPKVTSIITDYLKQKVSIANLAKTDKTTYASKLKTLTSSLTSNLKTVLTAAQFTKFLGLKPATSSATNVLSQLFY
jgi:hypothetical protein